MSLPTSRNRSYAPDSPVRSADLNDLQDCIVGAKHPSLTYTIGAADFVISATGAAYAASSVPTLNVSQWEFSSAPIGRIVAPIKRPVGTRITQIVWHFDKGGNATQLTMKLRKRTGTTTTDLSSTVDLSSASGIVTVTVTPNYTIESGYQVWLDVVGGNAAHIFVKAEVSADRL